MEQRPLGRTGLQVSEVGFGAWGIGARQWIGADDRESLAALLLAVDRGVDFIDTALAYGDGHSERLVGRLLRERPAIKVATKIPPKNYAWPATAEMKVADCFPASHIVKSCETSLKNLDIETIDLLQLHTWHDHFLDEDSWQDAFSSLKRSGKVRFLGVSVSEHEAGTATRVVASGLIHAVQVLYNVFEQRPEHELFPLCEKHGVGVLARVPLDEGGLTGTITPETTFPKGDFRNQYFHGDRKREVFERVEALKGLLGAEAKTVPELALRFCLSHKAVSTVIPGMRRKSSVEASVAVSDGRRLSNELLHKLKGHAWPRNFYS
jgi:aryl-alcohol dehydrogenase-like predicted oxidoreductase